MGTDLGDRLNDRRPRLPLLLRVAMVLGGFFGIVGTTVGLAALISVVFTDSPFTIDQDPVPRSDFLALAVPFLLFYVLACITAGSAAWALWKQRSHARLLLVALLSEFIVGDTAMLVLARRLADVSAVELGLSATFFLVLVALALWYLFRKRSVVEYYESLSPTLPEVSTPGDA